MIGRICLAMGTLTLAAVMMTACAVEDGGCGSSSECKGDRICEDGTCVSNSWGIDDDANDTGSDDSQSDDPQDDPPGPLEGGNREESSHGTSVGRVNFRPREGWAAVRRQPRREERSER